MDVVADIMTCIWSVANKHSYCQRRDAALQLGASGSTSEAKSEDRNDDGL